MVQEKSSGGQNVCSYRKKGIEDQVGARCWLEGVTARIPGSGLMNVTSSFCRGTQKLCGNHFMGFEAYMPEEAGEGVLL